MKKAAFILVALFSATAQADYNNCLLSLVERPELESIRTKISLTGWKLTTFARMQDGSSPTEEERSAIAEWAKGREECFRANERDISRTNPPAAFAVIQRLHIGVLTLAADIVRGSINYGQFNTERVRLGQVGDSDFAAIRQQDINNASQAAAADDAQRKAEDAQRRSVALQYLLNNRPASPQAPQPYAMPPASPPITTNCSRIGDNINCTTR